MSDVLKSIVGLLRNADARKVHIKTDGYVVATLDAGEQMFWRRFSAEWLEQYLVQEANLTRRSMLAGRPTNIFLIFDGYSSVIHLRVALVSGELTWERL